jgi:mono/diheme cytochrome c family protein
MPSLERAASIAESRETPRNLVRALRPTLAVARSVALAWTTVIGAPALAQQAAQPQAPQEAKSGNYYQRSGEIYEFRKAAQSGAERGREIFYYKCWFCHNEFTTGAPRLDGLYRHPTLISGQPVNDQTVKAKIRDGGPGMAAYKYTLSEADLDDLVAFVRDACCWNSDSPPLNPRYRAR